MSKPSEKQKPKCIACVLLARGIKPKTPPAHICARALPQYKEPETIAEHSGTYYKLLFIQRLAQREHASLYSLPAQWLNGHRVSRGTTLWLRDADTFGNHTPYDKRPERWVWVHESRYFKLTFV